MDRKTNQDFIQYDQVEKRQTYQLAESDGVEEFDDDPIAVIGIFAIVSVIVLVFGIIAVS